DNSPLLTSVSAVNVAENSTTILTVTATDADVPAQTLSFAIVGGADQGKFSLTSTGVLTFQAAPDFENPADANTDNIYVVQVQAKDGRGARREQTQSVAVTPANKNSPLVISASAVSVVENTTTILIVTATDADVPA